MAYADCADCCSSIVAPIPIIVVTSYHYDNYENRLLIH